MLGCGAAPLRGAGFSPGNPFPRDGDGGYAFRAP